MSWRWTVLLPLALGVWLGLSGAGAQLHRDASAPVAATAAAALLPPRTTVQEVLVAGGGVVRASELELTADGLRAHRPNGVSIDVPFDAIAAITHRTVWLGTDQQGRDVLARLLVGAQRSLIVGLLAAAFALVLGVGTGLAGFVLARRGGTWRALPLHAMIDGLLSIPRLLFLLVLLAVVGTSDVGAALAVGATLWMELARAVDAEAWQYTRSPARLAVCAAGVPAFRTLVRHRLPALSPLLGAWLPVLLSRAMLLEASVGFLGYAAAESDSWGRMIGDGRRYLPQAWWLVLAPGVLLLVVSWAAGRVDSRPR